jgi:hypothetical protein
MFSLPLRAQKNIDRHALVIRHNVNSNVLIDTLPVGNGEFAFSFDGTGLQTFAGNTMSHWGWHNFSLPPGYKVVDVPYTGTFERGRLVRGQIWPNEHDALSKWLFDNPHRMNLGRLRLRRLGSDLSPSEITGLSKLLDLWTGLHTSRYEIDGQPVRVETCVHPTFDLVAIHVESPLLANGGLEVQADFPYPSLITSSTWVGDFAKQGLHKSVSISRGLSRVDIKREVDATHYSVAIAIRQGTLAQQGVHAWVAKAKNGAKAFDLLCQYAKDDQQLPKTLPTFIETRRAAAEKWRHKWLTGGAIDLSASRDLRWKELERRIVLSQYQMAVQSAGSLPPSENGLMNTDPWRGQFHMEMIWWHLAHYALWNRWDMADKALAFYEIARPRAEALAKQLNYKGMMWPKMTGPEGRNSVWVGNNILQWKEPHPIFFAELEYRLRPTRQTLDKWKGIVFGTADFMADYPIKDPTTGQYSLQPLMTANERVIGKDGVFELAYWRFGLAKAQEWRRRLRLPPDPKWDEVRKSLSPLPKLGDVYIEVADWTDNYTAEKAWEHPDPIGAYGMLPLVDGVDPVIARNTVRKVWETWNWERTWGWDFPWMAMAAARTGQPQIAVDALLHPSKKNKYPENGICDGWYLPGNGGLLYAVAMMAAGWDGAPQRNAPGFPDDGNWVVKWEGLKRAP